MVAIAMANDHVFYPSGIRYLNVGAIPFVRRMLISLRRGQKQDIQKLWARNYFRNQLPIELVNYSYKASFGGIYYKGLKVAEEEILALTSKAYSITKIPELNPNNMKKLVAQVLGFSNKSEFKPAGGLIGAGVDDLKWHRPVRVGDQLTLDIEIVDIRPSKSKPNQGIVRLKVTTLNQKGEEVLSYIANLVLRRSVT